MDTIQEGFITIKKLPEGPLIKAIYNNTKPGSKLREFSIAGILYSLRTTDGGVGILQDLLKTNDEACVDLVHAIRDITALPIDPRVRDCGGEPSCVECANKPEGVVRAEGVWPCQFHVHQTISDDGQQVVDTGCYLWDISA